MEQTLVDAFVRDGFVRLAQAVPAAVAGSCARLLWDEIDAEPDDPRTWRKPVYWVGGMGQAPFREAATVPVLLDALDALVGVGRWQARDGLGAFPLRFPHGEEPDDAGWHIEGSYTPAGENSYFTNVYSSYRAALVLYLFTDVGEEDAPTRIRVGSHGDVPGVLRAYGKRGASGFQLSPLVEAASAQRPTALATGRAGDVFVCHPFLVHAAQPHHGTRPRFLAQPCILPSEEHLEMPFLDSDAPIGRSIREALNSQP
jgi:hypothetical protein